MSGSCVWAVAHQSVCRAWLRCNAGAAPTWVSLASVHAGAIAIHLQTAGAAPVAPAGQAPQEQQQQQQQQQRQQQRQQQPPSRGFSQPLSDIYELSSSSDDERDAPLRAARLTPAPAAANCVAGPAGPADAPRPAAKPGPTAAAANGPGAANCPICDSSLAGLPLEQQQRHINACCDAAAQGGSAKPAAAGLKQPGWQTDRQVAEHEQDTIPAYRPCFQQEQQPPAAVQQQQPHGARQSAGAAAAKTAAAGAGRQPLQPAAVANEPQLQPPEQPAQQQLCKVCGAELSHLRVQQQVSHVKACMAGRGGKLAQQQQQQQQQAKVGKRQAPRPQPDAQPAKRPAQQQQQQHAALVPPHPLVPPAPQQQQRQQQQQRRLPAVAPAAAAAPAPPSNLQEMSIGQWLQVCTASAVSKASSVWMQ